MNQKDDYDYWENLESDYGFSYNEMEGIRKAVDQHDRDLLAKLEKQAHVYNAKSTDGVMNEPNTGVMAISLEAVHDAIKEVGGSDGTE